MEKTKCIRCGADTTGDTCNHGPDWCCDCYEETQEY